VEILDHATVQDCTKLPSLMTNVLPKLVRDINNGVCHQRYDKRLVHQKRSSKCWCFQKKRL